jgi:hypothetical protein
MNLNRNNSIASEHLACPFKGFFLEDNKPNSSMKNMEELGFFILENGSEKALKLVP